MLLLVLLVLLLFVLVLVLVFVSGVIFGVDMPCSVREEGKGSVS